MLKQLKRIFALAGVILLAGLYIVTLILAFVDPTASKDWLKASISATLVIPVLLYAYMLVYKLLTKNKDEK